MIPCEQCDLEETPVVENEYIKNNNGVPSGWELTAKMPLPALMDIEASIDLFYKTDSRDIKIRMLNDISLAVERMRDEL